MLNGGSGGERGYGCEDDGLCLLCVGGGGGDSYERRVGDLCCIYPQPVVGGGSSEWLGCHGSGGVWMVM